MGVTIDYFDSNYTPVAFDVREKMIDLADKLSMLPPEIRKHYESLIQYDYDKVMLKHANEPVYKRRSNSQIAVES